MRFIVECDGFISRDWRDFVKHVAACAPTSDDGYSDPLEFSGLPKLANPWHKKEQRKKVDKSCESRSKSLSAETV